MTTRTSGIRLRSGSAFLRNLVELLSAMRFAIALLMLVAIASVIGTVVEQNKPAINYINQFGPFWADVFTQLGFFNIYNTPWFLLVMAVLVISTVLCVARNSPAMLAQAAQFKENISLAAIKAHAVKGEVSSQLSLAEATAQAEKTLRSQGFAVKRKDHASGAVLLAAKKGGAQRWGYILAHSAMVIILVGGVLDSELPVKLTAWWSGKTPALGNQLISQLPPENYLQGNTMSYRANVLVPDGASTQHALISYQDGVLVQPLPFELKLKKFNIEYYATGMPRLFESHVEVFDPETKKRFEQKIIVNEPLRYKGVTVYQSSFDDGGSKLKLNVLPLAGDKNYSLPLSGAVGEATTLGNEAEKITLEFTGLRTINVEDFSQVAGAAEAQNLETENNEAAFKKHAASVVGPASNKAKALRNVGPSIQYKVRDAAGQAAEYTVYQMPVELEQQAMLLVGQRLNSADGFRYIRFPANDDGSLTDYMRFRAALANESLRSKAAAIFAKQSSGGKPELEERLKLTALRSLSAFAVQTAADKPAGFLGLARELEGRVPPAEQERAAQAVSRVITSVSWEVLQLARLQAGLPLLKGTPQDQQFLQSAVAAYSDSFLLKSPVLLTLQSFEQIQASVFQVTKSPGKFWVYLGCLMLVLGVFAMFYVRMLRQWVWVSANENGVTLNWAVHENKPVFNSKAASEWQSGWENSLK